VRFLRVSCHVVLPAESLCAVRTDKLSVPRVYHAATWNLLLGHNRSFGVNEICEMEMKCN
jgi:hypothetical protein